MQHGGVLTVDGHHWLLAVFFLALAVHHALTLRVTRFPERVAGVVHVAMALAMAAMALTALWSTLQWALVVVFAVATLWFAAQAVQVSAGSRPANVRYAVCCAAMLLMVALPEDRISVGSVLVALLAVTAWIIWDLERAARGGRSHLAVQAAMTLGMAGMALVMV